LPCGPRGSNSESLDSLRIVYGREHVEYKMYEDWVRVISEELDKRRASRLY
jgi:hypothetical protein